MLFIFPNSFCCNSTLRLGYEWIPIKKNLIFTIAMFNNSIYTYAGITFYTWWEVNWRQLNWNDIISLCFLLLRSVNLWQIDFAESRVANCWSLFFILALKILRFSGSSISLDKISHIYWAKTDKDLVPFGTKYSIVEQVKFVENNL